VAASAGAAAVTGVPSADATASAGADGAVGPRCRRPDLPERRQVERLGVGDDLAAPRREDSDERADDREVEVAARPADDLEHVGPAGPVDVTHGSQLGAVGIANRDADQLVPEVRAARQRVRGTGLDLEVGHPETLRRLARGNLREAQDPARVGGTRLDDRERVRRK
jgi:hypothetical protein